MDPDTKIMLAMLGIYGAIFVLAVLIGLFISGVWHF